MRPTHCKRCRHFCYSSAHKTISVPIHRAIAAKFYEENITTKSTTNTVPTAEKIKSSARNNSSSSIVIRFHSSGNRGASSHNHYTCYTYQHNTNTSPDCRLVSSASKCRPRISNAYFSSSSHDNYPSRICSTILPDSIVGWRLVQG